MSRKETMYLLFDRKKFTMDELWDEETGYGGNFDEFMDGCHPGVDVYEEGEFLYAFNDGRIDPKKQFLVLR
jgi:hypothetical protein